MALPSEIHPLSLASPNQYKISRSLRFNSADSAYLNRTPASAGNRKTWTWSGWVKRGALGTGYIFSSAGPGGFGIEAFIVFSSDTLDFNFDYNAGSRWRLVTTQLFRDPSAWYHLVVCADTTNATSTDRLRIYVNGVRVTAFSTINYPTLNADGTMNQAYAHNIGQQAGGLYLNGYLTEINFIDGQALTPSSFGLTDPVTGVWVPKKYTGTYGTNGFYLNFSDNSGTTSSTLGKDSSVNGNNWTPNNFSVTAGVGNDSLTDTPSNNFATLNNVEPGITGTISNGNLSFTGGGAAEYVAYSTQTVMQKTYVEAEVTNIGNVGDASLGICPVTNNAASTNPANSAGSYAVFDNKNGSTNPAIHSYGSTTAGAQTNTVTRTPVVGDMLMLAFDPAGGKLWLGVNNSWLGGGDPATDTSPTYSGISTVGLFKVFVAVYGTTTPSAIALNAGQRPFAYTAPAGFKALNTANLPVPTIRKPSQFMNIATYTGTGATRSITGLGFQPDLVWTKSRSNAETHKLVDSVRGATKALSSETTGDEVTESGITSFNSDGFTIDGATDTGYNTNTYTYVGWAWKKDRAAGFDIVTYTGNGSARTIAHNLGAVPHFMIAKARTTASTDQGWPVYHRNNTAAPETDYLLLNSTAATADLDTVWNDTAPTSSVFSVGTNALVNTSGDSYVAYLWTEIPGFSRFGSYTGNGSANGPFVWCGFRPRWVLIKRTDTVSAWELWDTSRNTYNAADGILLPYSSSVELVDSTNYALDILSNGFKPRTTDSGFNTSTATYIFAAFAESPFKTALAR